MDTTQTTDYFAGKDFADVQKALELQSKINTGKGHIKDMKTQKTDIMTASFVEENGRDILDAKLAKFKNADELAIYLKGNVLVDPTLTRINEFFEDNDGQRLTLKASAAKKLNVINDKNKKHLRKDLEFKRELLLYFKRMDDAIAGITEEQAKLEEAQKEFDKNLSTALNPLKDNILAYADHLEREADAMEGIDYKTKKLRDQKKKKAYYIRSGYTFENMIALVKDNPGLVRNALSDFRNDNRLTEIGKQYGKKLEQGNIGLTLFPLLGNYPEDSLEFKLLPMDSYPTGLEGFTAVFLIRYLAHELPSMEAQVFQASVYTALQRALDNTLDKDVLNTIKNGMIEFLSYFK